jgi:RNA polymerase sigma-70 factor (ECF subfamily)
MTTAWVTRQTLLNRATDPSDEQAWEDFVDYYEGFINMLLGKLKIFGSDADDLAQETLLSLWKHLERFKSDPQQATFRTWLSRIVRNKVLNHLRNHSLRQQKKELLKSERLHLGLDFSESELDDIIEQEWKRYITQRALSNIESRFSGSAIEVFKLALLNHSNAKIAAALDLAESSVRTLKGRVQKALVDEVAKLIHEIEEEPH